MKILKYEEEKYPLNLKEIKKPPKLLYYEGNINLLKTKSMAVIGSRKCSDKGKIITKQFTKQLIKQGLTIISGMAIGIDTQAHMTAIEEQGNTIAVLPSGFKKIYPEENLIIFKKILQNKGLIITEYEENTEADSKKFLERNRIISGLSIGILIVEAMYRSGTSITAKIAKEQNKKIFAIPHEIDNKLGKGTNRLIQEGAILVTSVENIIKEYPEIKYNKEEIKNINKKEKIKQRNIKRIKKQQKTKKIENKIIIQSNKKILEKSSYNQIYNCIKQGISTNEEIHIKTQKNMNEINNILIMLEIEGCIKKVGGGYICI